MAEIHDALYSYALFAAFVCAGAALVWDLARVVVPALRDGGLRSDSGATLPGRARGARVLSAIAAAALLSSIVVHARWGHGASSAEPMGFGQLLSAHPAFLWAAMILVFAGLPSALIAARARERRSNPPP